MLCWSSVEFLLTSAKSSKTSFLWANKQHHLRLIISIFTLLEHAKLFYNPWVEGNDTQKFELFFTLVVILVYKISGL